ncbi:hypothetical protein GSI_05057 [Ganoderma sinense ZZ0214-1]|uniref:Uncharacterized protein n=1 Tax=Ganoderma sinense ZZ0214-1 TaxID=1077348 RepID=A0A2G8SGN9_9APHY|nr:hypothetical protein GSI_05057 [Ganoderma sinense ZZ0214-1]
MARTKQTARNSTGGKAPRKRLVADIEITSGEEDGPGPVKNQPGRAAKAKRAKVSYYEGDLELDAFFAEEQYHAEEDQTQTGSGGDPSKKPEKISKGKERAEKNTGASDAYNDPEEEPEEMDADAGDESKKGGAKKSQAKEPREKEPTGPVNYDETSDLNGGNLIACDEDGCRRVMCMSHAPAIEELAVEIIVTLHFRCPSCHTLKSRTASKAEQAVEKDKAIPRIAKQPPRAPKKAKPRAPKGQHVHVQKGKDEPKDKPAQPYYGLYYAGTETPYLPNWIRLDMTSTRPQHSRVDTSPIIIINFRLNSLRERSSPAKLVHGLITPWFDGPARRYLRYIDIPFNLPNLTDAELAEMRTTPVQTLLNNARIFMFLYTHSHDQFGDLYYGDNFSSVSVEEWCNNMLPPKLIQIASAGNNQLYVGLLACGALIMQERARTELKAMLTKHRVSHAFGFSTKALQPSLTSLFFYNFIHQVLIEGMPLTHGTMATRLKQAVFIARHTPVFHFYRDEKKGPFQVSVMEYRWTHNTMRPNGEDIGIQCPQCGTLSSREGRKKVNKEGQEEVVVRCKISKCGWEQKFPIVGKVTELKTGENGAWTVRDFDKTADAASA